MLAIHKGDLSMVLNGKMEKKLKGHEFLYLENLPIEQQYYIYAHYKKNTEHIFYIGLGQKTRAWVSTGENQRTDRWHNIVNKYGYEIKILNSFCSQEDVNMLEPILITEYKLRGQCEANYQSGGNDYGYMHKDTKDKISRSITEMWQDEGYKIKQKEGFNKAKELNAISNRINWQNPEFRAKHKKGVENARGKLSDSITKKWQDPEYRNSQYRAVKCWTDSKSLNLSLL